MWSDAVEVVIGPRIDAVHLRMQGSPDMHGFRVDTRGCWRRQGWRAAEKRDGDGYAWTRAIAEAQALADGTAWRAPWADEAEVTRLDVFADVRNAYVGPSLLDFMSGHRGTIGMLQNARGATCYVGSRRSPCMLRIYIKAKEGVPPPAWLEEMWGGWRGEEVTRVEFELKREAVAGITFDVLKDRRRELTLEKWRDALARLVMRAKAVENYAERNKAPVAPGWEKLGQAERTVRPKRARRDEFSVVCGAEKTLARILARAARSGLDVERIVQHAKEVELTAREEKRAKAVARALVRAQELLWLHEQEDDAQ